MKSLCLLLLLSIGAMPACSHYSSSARQQRAYTKYLSRSMKQKTQRQARIRDDQSKIMKPEEMPLEPSEVTQTSDSSSGAAIGEGPQAVPRE